MRGGYGLWFVVYVCLQAQPSGLAGWMAAIESADRSVLAANAHAPAGLAAELRQRLPQMKDPARVVAAQVLEKVDSVEGATVLLSLVGDRNLSVASAASRALRNSRNLPDGQEILRAIPAVGSAPIRAHLYLAAGKAKAPLAALRKTMAAETDASAKQAALAAAIRLGGDTERTLLAAQIRGAKASEVVPLMDLLVYTGDKRMASALVPLFDSSEPVMRISPDPESRMARRSDLAVWTAHGLGLVPQLRLTGLRRFDAATIAAARSACAREK